MEGLIPMVYRSLKKNKTRRQYECLSSEAADTFIVKDDISGQQFFSTPGPGGGGGGGVCEPNLRRYNSVSIDFYASGRGADSYKPQKQLVRFRSHKMFSCVTGGA